MPTIDFNEAAQDGVDFVRHVVSNTDWDTYTFGATVESVQIRSRTDADIRISRTETGTFSATGNFFTLKFGREYGLSLISPAMPGLPRVGTLEISHANATGEIEFEIRSGGR